MAAASQYASGGEDRVEGSVILTDMGLHRGAPAQGDRPARRSRKKAKYVGLVLTSNRERGGIPKRRVRNNKATSTRREMGSKSLDRQRAVNVPISLSTLMS